MSPTFYRSVPRRTTVRDLRPAANDAGVAIEPAAEPDPAEPQLTAPEQAPEASPASESAPKPAAKRKRSRRKKAAS